MNRDVTMATSFFSAAAKRDFAAGAQAPPPPRPANDNAAAFAEAA
jgi:hypothetical protein